MADQGVQFVSDIIVIQKDNLLGGMITGKRQGIFFTQTRTRDIQNLESLNYSRNQGVRGFSAFGKAFKPKIFSPDEL